MNKILSFEEFYNSVWLKVPSVWRDADDDNGKALQLLVYTMAQHMYHYYYNKIVYMDQLFDPDLCPAVYLKFLASMVGWNLIGNDEKSWREQIKAAPLLYKVKGTKRGIALAERLVGYSVFISDLYRDHLGEIVPKEMAWNNTPDTITNKPWFRTTLRDDSGNTIPGAIESDLFDSYNEGDAFLNTSGKVIRPFSDTSTNNLIARTISTTSDYDATTGSGSLARYAKTPRINVVLKKLDTLDATNSDGTVLDSNIDAAVDLLLQFKPFHVYINDIKVLVDISDSALGSTKDITSGTGDNTDDTINAREFCDFSVYINTENDVNETISYQPTVSSVPPTYWTPNQSSTITAKFQSFSLANLPNITDVQFLNNLSISTKDYVDYTGIKYGYAVVDGHIVDMSDFLTSMSDTLLTQIDDIMSFDYTDAATQTVLYNSLSVVPAFGMRLLDISSIFSGSAIYHFKSAFISKHNLFNTPLPTISNVVLSNLAQRDTVTVAYNSTTETQNYTTGTAWSLKNFNAFDIVSGLGPGTLTTQNLIDRLQTLFTNTFMVVLEYNGTSVIVPPSKYTLFNQQIILDTVGIAKELGPTFVDDSFIETSTLHILYLEQSKEASDCPTEKTSRSMYLNTRSNKQFSRCFDQQNVDTITSEKIKAVEQYNFDKNTGTLVFDEAHTRVYRTESTVYTRGTLASMIADGQASGITPVITKNNLNVCDKHQWKVYSNLYSMYYAGSEKVSSVWWTDFYQPATGTVGNNYLVDYSDIDVSPEAQIVNRSSARWKAAQQKLDFANPNDFLATRKSSSKRNGIWNRGSALRLSLPFHGDNRRNYQSKRGNTTLFNRTENLSDYATQITGTSTVSNFRYMVNNTNIDLTQSYFNPAFEEPNTVVPAVYNFSPSKLKIHPTIPSYTISTPNETSIYDGSMSFSDRLTYYSSISTGDLHISPYSCNMVIRDYPTLPGLIHDSLDTLDIMVEGLVERIDNFKVIVENGDAQTSFLLTYLDMFVSWYEHNTGNFINSGNFSNVINAIPNVKVFINGIQVLYGSAWTMSLSKVKAINIITPLQETDTIRVEYFTLSSNVKLTKPPFDEAPRELRLLLTDSQLSTVLVDGNLFKLQLPDTALVSWYDGLTGEYLSTSSNAYTLMPDVNFDTAYPNVQVFWNGIASKYGEDWRFASSLINGISQNYIELLPEVSYRLYANDTIEVKYQIKQ